MVESAERYRRDDEGDEDDEEEEEVDETGYKAVKDAVLFAIDISQSMLEPISSGKDSTESAASAALKCAYSLMQQRIISNPRDMMGILLFGTEASKFQDGAEESSKLAQYPHCYLLADLDVPAAADVKRLRSLVQDEDASRSLLQASTEEVAMSNVLFCANQIFTTKAPNFSSRRLFLVTDNDRPHADSKDLRASAVVRARDLYDLGVIIELFPISRQGHEFDRSVFYDDVVYQANPTDPEAPAPLVQAAKPASGEDGLALLNSLLSSINSKSVPKRALFSNLPLELSPTLRISVKGYIIYKKQVPQRTCFVWTEGEKPQIAVGTTTRLADETARTVDKGEIRKAYKFGGEAITFTPDEVTELRSFGDPVIRILGFKPLSLLPPWAVIKPATFVYPSEEEFVGSTRLFSALQQTLLAKQRFALVWYIARKNATPVIAALVAGKESRGDFGEQDMPAGLWLCPLPFADDIRQNPQTARHVVAPDPLVDRMRDIMTQLLLPKATYDPAKYPNPSLQWHYRILQAIALEEDLPEQAEDKTIPRYRQIDKRVGEFAKAWGQELDKQYQKWQRDNGAQGTGVGSKRPAADTERSVPEAKKSRATPDPSSLSITDDDMRSKFKKQRIATLGVNDLKAWIKSKSLGSVTGLKKADLVDMIESYFENKMEVD